MYDKVTLGTLYRLHNRYPSFPTQLLFPSTDPRYALVIAHGLSSIRVFSAFVPLNAIIELVLFQVVHG